MGKRYIRVYQQRDILEIKEHLLIYGDLTANCANCQAIDIKFDSRQCPECKTAFKYIAFRNIKHHLPKLPKLQEERPDLIIVDHEDFARHWGAMKAQEFLK